jgi:capping protein alpha
VQATTDDPIPFSADETLEMDRAALQSSIAKYVSASFQPEETACGVYAKDGSLVVTIASERPNLRNYWSGRWTSTWTIRNKTISGEVKVGKAYHFDKC